MNSFVQLSIQVCARSYAGQVGNLRRIGNPPAGSTRNSGETSTPLAAISVTARFGASVKSLPHGRGSDQIFREVYRTWQHRRNPTGAALCGRRITNPPQVNNLPHITAHRKIGTGEIIAGARRFELIVVRT